MGRRPKPSGPKPSGPKLSGSVPGSKRLTPPKDGAVVRMYRIGHGDCFLLGFDGDEPGKPVYVLIDCGYKPGSPGKLTTPTKVADVATNIMDATGGAVDVAVITHEHQDHCNGITEENFGGLKIGELWLAWTENPKDDLANRLRARFKDQLLGLLGANQKLAASLGVGADDADTPNPNDSGSVREKKRLRTMVKELLELELGDAAPFAPSAFAAAKGPTNSANKRAMALFKRLASDNVEFHEPHDKVRRLARASAVRIFSLGPPRDEEKLKRLDPVGKEEFHVASGFASASAYFGAAAGSSATGDESPFPQRFIIPMERAFPQSPSDRDEVVDFFDQRYGSDASTFDKTATEVGGNERWRRIDDDWLQSAGALALAMNSQTNNASLVLAFELGARKEKPGKVLLFAADAQAGNWRSWSDKDWKDGEETITSRELLSRTVLYKVGHHGSHNATLDGAADDVWPNISWMAKGEHGREFTAMITAVEAWAHQKPKPDWDHPLPSIKKRLLEKASGRVLQTDTDFSAMEATADSDPAEWSSFDKRLKARDALYFDLEILP